jgi:hypothetical protein
MDNACIDEDENGIPDIQEGKYKVNSNKHLFKFIFLFL